MPKTCPRCLPGFPGFKIVYYGFFYRTSDSRHIQRFRCNSCRHTFSRSCFQTWFREKKRLKNLALKKHLASGGSLRRAALNFHLNRKTVAHKLRTLGFHSEFRFRQDNRFKPLAKEIEFDDLETFVHTKCKPVSVTLAVESKTRRILAFEVSSMAAKGRLSKKALAKYGPRFDGRREARKRLFLRLRELVAEDAIFKSDDNPHYPGAVKKYFPKAKHITVKGGRGSLGGQGELKKLKFDPLFSLNHTCAMLRANINRLFRKTWCTTKKVENLSAHLYIYAHFHNEKLI